MLNISWDKLRDEVPVSTRFAYFDNAAVAPIAKRAANAMRAYCDQAEQFGDTVWPQWAKRVEHVRKTAAEIIGASTDEIALLNSTTAGIGLVAEGFPWKDGDSVVMLADEFPTNQYPWLHLASRGVEVRRVSCRPEEGAAQLLEACDSSTRLLAVSWVSFSSGWRFELDALVEQAHQKGVLVLLDAIQGMGVFPLDVRQTPVDFLSADGHKWMLGPEGASVFFLQSEHLERLRPLNVGWNSVVGRMDYATIDLKFRADAARYEGGSQNMVGVTGLGGSLELLREYGLRSDTSAIAGRVLELTSIAVERLQSIGATFSTPRPNANASGIVSFEFVGRDPNRLRQRCLEADVVLSCRNGRLRISPHAYNNEDDIDRLIDVLRVVE